MDPRAKLAEALMAGRPSTATLDGVMEFLGSRPMPIGQRESANVEDQRNFANESDYVKGSAQFASEMANILAGAKYYMNKLHPPVGMAEIGDLLPGSGRVGGFATMRRP